MKNGLIFRKLLYRVRSSARSIRKRIRFNSEFRGFKKLSEIERGSDFSIRWEDRYPIYNEDTATTKFDAHYIYHTAWAARVVAESKPTLHIDISSILYFATLVSSFVPVEFYDYRPANISLSNLTCKFADLRSLPFPSNSIQSLSCMHVIEHIGLGRYGDEIDPNGDIKAINELKRVMAPGGNLLFVTPVGKPRIRFNAHRIYSYEQIAGYFSDLSIAQFALVDDKSQFTINPDPGYASQQDYGCGCWLFKKGNEITVHENR